MAFRDAAVRSGKGSLDKFGSGVKPSGTQGVGAYSFAAQPTTSAGLPSSTIWSRSSFGSLAEIGWGVAPNFHVAKQASMNPMLLGRPIVTNWSWPTPSA